MARAKITEEDKTTICEMYHNGDFSSPVLGMFVYFVMQGESSDSAFLYTKNHLKCSDEEAKKARSTWDNKILAPMRKKGLKHRPDDLAIEFFHLL